MSKINFKFLVERLLIEQTNTLGEKIKFLIPSNNSLIELATWAWELSQTGSTRLKKDTLLGMRPVWPIIDTLYAIIRILQGYSIINVFKEQQAEDVGKCLNKALNEEEFLSYLLKLYPNSKIDNNQDIKNKVVQTIQEKIENLFENYNNYRQWTSTRLKQLIDQTQTLAAEEYLNLSPYDSIMKLLKEYGGYDIKLVKNIIYYPGETRYTQKSNIDGPILATIVEISKLMLLFYREEILKQISTNEKIKNLNIEENNFKNILDKSAGKINATFENAGNALRNDYKNFTHGKSIYVIDEKGPLITKVADFSNRTGMSQEIYEAFLSLFNNIKKGTNPNGWKVAGKAIFGAINSLTDVLNAITAFSGQTIYGGTR